MLTQKDTEVKDKINQVKEGGATVGIQTKNLALNVQLLETLQTLIHDLMGRGTVFNWLACLPEIRSRLQKMQSSVEESADDANDIVVPNSTELLLSNLDGLLLQHPVKLGSDDETASKIYLLMECCSENEKVRRTMKIKFTTEKLSSKLVYYSARLFFVCLFVCFSSGC